MRKSNALANTVLMLIISVSAFIALTLMVAAVARAVERNCSHVTSTCVGTENSDDITGGPNNNWIDAKTGRDNIWAYPGDDDVLGGGDADNANGGDGYDGVYGEWGNDSYFITGGNDGLFGGANGDVLRGNDGHDYVEGGAGSDDMYGGPNNDRFFAEDGQPDTVNGGQSSIAEPCYVDGHDTWISCVPY